MAEYSAIYDTAIDRIRSCYATCGPAEQALMRKILQEMADKGYSVTLEQTWLADFSEIPVGIDQFLNDENYLGRATNGGESVFPYWRQTFKDIFDAGNRYNEIILSGATRIGKTSTAITILAYMLYRLMLYRDPHKYFSQKPTARFTFVFANLTKELATGVAFFEFNSTIKESPWFLDRGKMSKSEANPIYMPNGDKINILPCSDAAHALGMQVFCLKGDTKLLTLDGIKSIEECSGSYQKVLQCIDDRLVPTEAYVAQTGLTDTLIRIELEDGSVLEGTPDHKVMLSNGQYKALKDLSSSDDLLTFNTFTEVDEMNLKDLEALFTVYMHVSPEGKRYIGITTQKPEDRWLAGGLGYKENSHFWSAIAKYGWDNFEHLIVATGLNLQQASDMESELISKYDCMNPDKGYNHTSGGNWSKPDEATRHKLSQSIKQRCADPEYRKGMSERLIGHSVSAETRAKISESKSGKPLSEETRMKMKGRKLSPEHIEKLKGHGSWSKGLNKNTNDILRAMSDRMKGKNPGPEWRAKVSESRKLQYVNGYSPIWINDGRQETTIQQGQAIPSGFVRGRLNRLDTYIHKGNESKKVAKADVSEYLLDGWELGRPCSVGTNIRKSNQRMHWMYEGVRYDTAESLANQLRNNGYPAIVGSTITSLSKKGFSTSPTYKSLDGKVLCVMHEN